MVKTEKPTEIKVDILKIIESTTRELLDLMKIGAEIEVAQSQDTESVLVNLDTSESAGLLIGHHGENLNSIQSVLSLIVKQKTGDWVRLVVNVGDWREKQDTQYKELAAQTAQRSIDTGEPQPIYNLTPAQRRVIHMELTNNDQVTTESQGEGQERYLVVKPK